MNEQDVCTDDQNICANEKGVCVEEQDENGEIVNNGNITNSTEKEKIMIMKIMKEIQMSEAK